MDYSISTGKCSDCEQHKPLDSMLRKEYKGVYHCIDCFVSNYDNLKEGYEQFIKTENKDEKIRISKKILGWLFG